MRARAALWPALAVLASIAIAWARIAPFARLPIGFDGQHTYLPMARRVLDQGLAFLGSPESLATAPLAYLWPALLGADATAVRWANLVAFCAAIALAAWAVRLAHSWRAAVIGAFLLALSPVIRPFIVDVATEAPYIFLLGAWMLAVARIGSPPSRGWATAWVAAGGIALAAATLTRPAAMYFAPAMIVVFWLLRSRRLAAMHALATALVALWVLRNAFAFAFPAVASGAGTALFLGVNPLVDGFDPAYFGLIYDDGAATQMPDHLSIAADRLLSGIAVTEVRDTPLLVLAQMAAHKAFAFLFVTAAEASGHPLALLRAWRVGLVVFAIAGAWHQRRAPLVVALAAMCAYMVAVHLPVLYNFRYSVSALDLPLTLLAAIGIVETLAAPRRAAIVVFAAVLAVGAGLAQLAAFGFAAPRIERIPVAMVWSRSAGTIADVRVEGGQQVAPAAFELGPRAAIEFPVREAPLFHPWDVTVVSIDLAFAPAPHARDCDAMTIAYRRQGEPVAAQRARRIPIEADGRMHRLVVGGAAPLAINHEGLMRLEFDCAFPARVELGTIAVAAPRRATHYRELYLREHR